MTFYPVICLIGLVLSILSLITFNNPKFTEKIYYYLEVKTFVEILILTIGVLSPISTCLDPCLTGSTYFSAIFEWILIKYLQDVLYMFITVLRYTFVCALIVVPSLFTHTITVVNETYILLDPSEYGNSMIHKVYITCLNLLENALTILLLIPYNVLTFVEFRKFMKKKKRLTQCPETQQRILNAQSNFNKMILIVSFGTAELRVSSTVRSAKRRIFHH